MPADLGPWGRAAQTVIRWARLGVWERLLALVQERGVQLGMTFLDGPSIRAHQKAAGAARKGALQLSETIVKPWAALGGLWDQGLRDRRRARTGGGVHRSTGQAHELPHAIPLLDRLPSVPNGGELPTI